MTDVPVRAHPIAVSRRGIQLTSLEELARFAKYIAATPDLRPPSIDTEAKALLIIQAGLEIGFAPMASLRALYPVNGKPTVYGDAGTALINRSGLCDEWEEWWSIDGERCKEGILGYTDRDHYPDSLAAHCRLKRTDGRQAFGYFSVADAKMARVRSKAGIVRLWDKQGPWQDFPRRQLQWRARSWPMRDLFSDVLGGLDLYEAMVDHEGPLPPRDVERVVDYLPAPPETKAAGERANVALQSLGPAMGDDWGPSPFVEQPEQGQDTPWPAQENPFLGWDDKENPTV